MMSRQINFLILKLFSCCMLPMALPAQTWKEHSVLSEGQWYKIAVEETGIYRLGVQELPALEGLPFSQIGLYGGDAPQMAESALAPQTDDLVPFSYQAVDHNNNGRIDGDDYLLFFAEGVTTWRWDNALQRYTHQRHVYSNRNYLFLRTDSRTSHQVCLADQTTANQPDVSIFTCCGLYEQENFNTHNSGQVWVSDRFLNGNTKSLSARMPTTPSGVLQTRFALAVPDGSGRFTVACGSDRQEFSVAHNETYAITSASFNCSSPTFEVTFSTSGNTMGYLDFIEVLSNNPVTYSSGNLLIHNTRELGEGHAARHIISRAGEVPFVWDVSLPSQPQAMRTQTDGGTVSFVAATDQPRDYVIFTPTQALAPSAVSAIPNQDLHAAATPDLVIVAHQHLLPQAQRLGMLHETLDGMDVLVVTQDQVFNEFSSGKRDPMALRAMMSMLSSGERQPRYLLLFGKGTYDNRDLLGYGYTTLVTYESPESFTTTSYYSASDDIFGSFGTGRLPAKNASEAKLLVDKIERYLLRVDLEDDATRGDWRTYVALLADDADPSQASDVEFAVSSEFLASQIEAMAPWINLDKIYADSYQQQSGTIGSYYPDVNNALKQRMDYGCLLLNYIGHGSDQYIGTERYMEQADIENYRNIDRLPFFVTSTCSFGKYDKLDGVCGSEAFVLAQGAGIGCVAAARPISHIRSFNTCLTTNALNPNNTIGDALRIAKARCPMSQNVSIALMGDPALKICFPEHNVVVTAINNRPVEEGRMDSAMVLSKVTVEGEIRNHNNLLQSDFNGILYPIVFDRKQVCHTLANDNEGTEVDFSQQKNILYKGRDTVVNGRFTYSFIVPRDVAYQYGAAKLSHYAKCAATGSDAAGAYNRLMLGGFDENADISESRPEIRLFMGDTTFLPGGVTDADASLLAMLYDTIGINAVGSGLGHDITAVMDGNAYDVLILNDFYETDVANPDRGYIRYQFASLAPGRHTLTLKAWNIYNYSAEASIEFVVRGADSLSIASLRPYPNPTTGYVTLNVNHNCPNELVDARIEIYDLCGRRVASLSPTIADGTYSFSYTCDLGHLADGIYLARAIATTKEGTTLTASTKIVKKN